MPYNDSGKTFESPARTHHPHNIIPNTGNKELSIEKMESCYHAKPSRERPTARRRFFALRPKSQARTHFEEVL